MVRDSVSLCRGTLIASGLHERRVRYEHLRHLNSESHLDARFIQTSRDRAPPSRANRLCHIKACSRSEPPQLRAKLRSVNTAGLSRASVDVKRQTAHAVFALEWDPKLTMASRAPSSLFFSTIQRFFARLFDMTSSLPAPRDVLCMILSMTYEELTVSLLLRLSQ